MAGRIKVKRDRRLLVLGLLVVVFVLAQVSPALAFTDVPESSKYYVAIQDLAARGIINGYVDGRFGPNDPVSRQQYAKMICRTLNLAANLVDRTPFQDLESDYTNPFPNGYITAAWLDGITTGTSPTTFEPGSNISRAQVITMTMRALEKHHHAQLVAPSLQDHDLYADPLESLGPHALPALKAYANFLLEDDFDIVRNLYWADYGYASEYGDPWQPMPRQEVAAILHNVFEWVISGDVASSAYIQVSGSGVVETTTLTANGWAVTGLARVDIHARSTGDPAYHYSGQEKYAVCDATGPVTITVDDPGLRATIHGQVTELSTMFGGVHGASIKYQVGARTFDMYITDGPSFDTVFLHFLAPILGDGNGYSQRQVISGAFTVKYPSPI